ncbi:MAG: type IV-A pilus assembly ATPase PilB [Desulfobacterales bacterium]|jgi:type IV pilus assembly protein PilB|nr:type IV-A pilus assembly ATPase PilB [Desulfobacterales bacterium]
MAKPATMQQRPGTTAGKKSSLKATIRDQSGAGKTKIGEVLSKEGQITSFQLEEALNYQKKHDGRLGNILLRLGYIEDETISSVLSRIHNYSSVTISKITPDPEAVNLVPYEIAKKYMAFPFKLEGDQLSVVMAEPTDTGAVEGLQKEIKKSLDVSVSTERDIAEAYQKYYGISEEEHASYVSLTIEESEEEDRMSEVDDFGSLVSEALEDIELASTETEDISDQYSASDGPIIKLVNGILITAINEGVSDIHIEPFENSLQVRYRLDGSLYKSKNFPVSIKNALTSRIKILAGLNIAERRVPQDGRIKLKIGRKKAVDFRVSTLPTLFGESTVMRILDRGALNVDLTVMGFEKDTFAALKRCISRPYGLLLVTGPTGSGKTTTLYSILNRLNTEDTKILTAEDPVEFNFKGINQVNVRDEVGMTFAAALKAFLRQDPDIIMVGEIRDMDTAEIAIKAAMTGHLVFSTLHTNDCPSTIGRLIDIGIPPYMLASAVTMVLSQRLARKLCPNCKTQVDHYNPEELEVAGFSKEEIPELKLYGPQGCPACKGSGYKGRTGLYELMEVTDEVGKAISANVAEDQLRKTAIQEGMKTLRDAALEKARQGVISFEEVMKRTVITKESMPAYLVTPDVERYEDKDVIIREGNQDKDFFKLIQGALVVVKGGKKIAEITEPDEYFGEMAVLTNESRSASIISKGRSVIKRFPGDKLHEVIEKYPDVARHLFGIMASRLHHANEVTVNLINERLQRS